MRLHYINDYDDNLLNALMLMGLKNLRCGAPTYARREAGSSGY